MKLDKLIKLVDNMYYKIYDKRALEVKKVNAKKYELKFKDESIVVDNSTGDKYRITFEDYTGTNLKYRDLMDEALGFSMFCCDWSYFLDIPSSYIDKIYEYVV